VGVAVAWGGFCCNRGNTASYFALAVIFPNAAEMYTLITFRKAVEYRKGAENECERKSSGLPAGGEVKAKSEAGRTNWVDLQAEQDESRRQSKNQSQIKSAYDVAEKILLGG